MPHITALVVKLANARTKELNPENRAGNPQGTRKNPHVIDAGFEQDLLVNY
jgi:hypothetical protein